jgi:hypothetical protein
MVHASWASPLRLPAEVAAMPWILVGLGLLGFLLAPLFYGSWLLAVALLLVFGMPALAALHGVAGMFVDVPLRLRMAGLAAAAVAVLWVAWAWSSLDL